MALRRGDTLWLGKFWRQSVRINEVNQLLEFHLSIIDNSLVGAVNRDQESWVGLQVEHLEEVSRHCRILVNIGESYPVPEVGSQALVNRWDVVLLGEQIHFVD